MGHDLGMKARDLFEKIHVEVIIAFAKHETLGIRL